MNRRDLWLALVLVLVGLALRLWVIRTQVHPELSHDARNYHAMAEQLLGRGVYGYNSTEPNAYVPPGYPLFLTIIYALVGPRLGAVRYAQALLGALTVGLLYLTGKELGSWVTGLLAGLAAALYPTYLYMPTFLLTEVLYTFCFTLYLWLQVLALKQPGPGLSSAAGVALGLALLVRPLLLPFLPLPWLLFWWQQGRGGLALRYGGYAAVAVLVCLLPWWVRNLVTLKRFVLLSTGSANPILAGTDPYFMHEGKLWAGVKPEEQTKRAIEIVLQGLRTQPGLYIRWFTIGKLTRIFSKPFWFWGLWQDFNLRLHPWLVGLGGLGLLRGLFTPLPRRFVAWLTLGLVVVQLAFIPETRYNYPLMAPLMLLGAALLTDLGRWVVRRG